MSFWEKIQKDIRKNLKEGIDFFKEGGSSVTKKLEWLTEEGKKRYRLFNLNMKVQEEFAHLGGRIYDLTSQGVEDPLGNRRVRSIIKKIRRLEDQINKIEGRDVKKKAVRKKSRKGARGTTHTTGKKA